MPTKPEIEVVVVTGCTSGTKVEMDLGIIKTVMEWFVADAPKELRTLHNVGRVIRFNDKLIELIAAEKKSSIDYMEQKAFERIGLPFDGDHRFDPDYVPKITRGVFDKEGLQ